MKMKERIEYAEEMLNKGYITDVDEYMKIMKGNDIDQLEDKIHAMQQYLVYKKLRQKDVYE